MKKLKIFLISVVIVMAICGSLFVLLQLLNNNITTEATAEYYNNLQDVSNDITTAKDYIDDNKTKMMSSIKEKAVKALIARLLKENSYTSMKILDRLKDTNTDGSTNNCITYVVQFDDSDYWILKYDGTQAYALQDTVNALSEEYE